jgi:N-acetylglucosamine kinase-like BadF-type ATPase
MILIADSGSTKTEWVIIHNSKTIKQCFSMGINPYFIDTKGIIDIIETEVIQNLGDITPNKIFFYGSGCSTPTKKSTVENALKYFFPNASIQIEHDLLASARAVCGNKEGIACILGTGSNSCLYDGSNIIENVPSLGYLFADEGSGGYLGKLLLTNYLLGNLSLETTELFNLKYNYSLENILDAAYNKPKPNRFLASFSPFIHEHLHIPEVKEIAMQNFRDFFTKQVCKYSNYQKMNVSFIGSVAFYYAPLIHEIAKEYDLNISTIIKSPMEGLIKYHCSR